MWNKRCSSRTSASHNRSEAATQPGTQLRLVLCLFLILPVCVPVHHPLWCSTDRRCVLILPLCRPDVLGEWGVILLGSFFIIFAHILQVYSTFIVHLLLFIIIYYHSHSSFLVIFPGIWCLRRTLCLDAGSEVKGTSCFIISYWTSQKKHFSRVYMFFRDWFCMKRPSEMLNVDRVWAVQFKDSQSEINWGIILLSSQELKVRDNSKRVSTTSSHSFPENG